MWRPQIQTWHPTSQNNFTTIFQRRQAAPLLPSLKQQSSHQLLCLCLALEVSLHSFPITSALRLWYQRPSHHQVKAHLYSSASWRLCVSEFVARYEVSLLVLCCWRLDFCFPWIWALPIFCCSTSLLFSLKLIWGAFSCFLTLSDDFLLALSVFSHWFSLWSHFKLGAQHALQNRMWSRSIKAFLKGWKVPLIFFFLLMLLKTPSISALLLFFTSHCTLRQRLGFPSNQRLLNNSSAPGWALLTKMPFAVILRISIQLPKGGYRPPPVNPHNSFSPCYILRTTTAFCNFSSFLPFPCCIL